MVWVDGMVEVIATCPEGEEMIVLVEKSSVKKATPLPKVTEQDTYTVTRETIDPYYCHDNLEHIGTYNDLATANSVARNNLTTEWSPDYFDSLEVEDVDGMVHVDAMCPDGESMIVLVEKTGVKKAGAQKRVTDTPSLISVYHVIRETIDYHHDPDGGMQDTAIKGTYMSLEKANEVARKDLYSEWDKDFFEEYEEELEDEMVTINAICPEGEHMNVYVRKGTLTTDHAEMVGLVENMIAEMEDESEDAESKDGSEE